jgi:hypothetical protein
MDDEVDETGTSPNSSMMIARTRTESVIDRSSPYNIIETSQDDNDDDDDTNEMPWKSIDTSNDTVDPTNDVVEQKETISPSSSMTSATDVYMDAVDMIDDEQSGRVASIIINV